MNTQYNALEKSLLSDHTGLVTPSNQPLELADRHPRLYRLVVLLSSLTGYIFIYLFPLSLITTSLLLPQMILNANDHYDVAFALLSVAWILFSGWISWYVWQSRPDLPAGRPLKVEEAPMLFELIEDLRQKHKCPRVHQIRITREYHIEIVRTSRNGYPLNYTNSLLIGLPMLQSLSAKQFKFALQRQLIQLGSMYRRSFGWARFLSSIWDQYRTMYQNSWHPASLVMRMFFMVYTPMYRWLVKSAINEQRYYVDRMLADTDNARAVSEMIVTRALHRKYLHDQFWPELMHCAYQHMTPPYMPYASLQDHFHNELDKMTLQQLLDNLLFEQEQDATLPGLRQRLDRLGIHDIQLPGRQQHCAIRYLTEQARALIIEQFDNVWIKSCFHDWRRKYLQGQEEKNRLQDYQQQIDSGVLPDRFIHEYIQLVNKYLSIGDALAHYKRILETDFDDPRIGFDIGRTLLRHNDPQGIEALLKTMHKDTSFTVMACQLIIQYYVRIGDSRNAQVYRRKALAYQVEAA